MGDLVQSLVEVRSTPRSLALVRLKIAAQLTSWTRRNCNTFTEELVWRLTGVRPPAWINRASWVRRRSSPRRGLKTQLN